MRWNNICFTKGDIHAGLRWYYDRIRKLNVPEGVERKYANTEAFVKESVMRVAKENKKVFAKEEEL